MMSIRHAVVAALLCIFSAPGPLAAQSPSPNVELIAEFVVANRILADQGVVADGFGHLSCRSDRKSVV